MSLSAISRSLRAQVIARDHGRCRYCGLVQIGQAAVFHVNHVVPKSRGGCTEEANLVLQCPWCSLHKSDKVTVIDPQTGEEVLLFHPLRQTWDEHLSLNADGTCSGRSAIGRATVQALRMNEPLPLVARALQLRLGFIVPGHSGT